MPRESKDAVKRSVAVDSQTFEWVNRYAQRKGIDYTAAVNMLLASAKEEIEREDRIKGARENAYKRVDEDIAGGGDPTKGQAQ
jgi:hypothetical protein